MQITFPIEATVHERYSVRTYDEKPIPNDVQADIELFIKQLESPFGKEVRFLFLDHHDTQDKENLGTYGFIKGAKQFIGSTIEKEPLSLESLGYQFEVLVLYLVSRNLGTCWLGGTFNREGFAKAMQVGDDQLFPIISPYGYPADKKTIKERMVRRAIKADKRKKWKELFFCDGFDTPLAKEDTGDFEFALEMVRLAPSASNKQPWRVVIQDNIAHFFLQKTPGYNERLPYEIQKVDMGIAAAHFDLAMQEKKIAGHLDTKLDPKINMLDGMEYSFSWIID